MEVYDQQECVQNHTLEQIVNVPVPPILEAVVEVMLHKSACRIVLWSAWWMSLCLRS